MSWFLAIASVLWAFAALAVWLLRAIIPIMAEQNV